MGLELMARLGTPIRPLHWSLPVPRRRYVSQPLPSLFSLIYHPQVLCIYGIPWGGPQLGKLAGYPVLGPGGSPSNFPFFQGTHRSLALYVNYVSFMSFDAWWDSLQVARSSFVSIITLPGKLSSART